MRKKTAVATAMAVAMVIAVVAVIAIGTVLYLNSAPSSSTTETSSSSSTASSIQGVVTGYVTVGPAQPVCSSGQSCNVNMTGYSLIFTLECPGPLSGCPSSMAPLSPSGHYSILLPPGTYSVTGLSPNCTWMGCSSAFPKTVTVQGGMQVGLDVNIDTGIR